MLQQLLFFPCQEQVDTRWDRDEVYRRRLGIADDFAIALYKSMLASGYAFPQSGGILASIADKDKAELIPLLKQASDYGFHIYATAQTAQALRKAGAVKVETVNKVGEGLPNVLALIREGKIDLAVNTPTYGKDITTTATRSDACVEYQSLSYIY